jgi:hypothetical protein
MGHRRQYKTARAHCMQDTYGSGCVILIAFPRQQWLRERASMLCYVMLCYVISYFYIFEKYSNIKFRENASSGSRVVPRGQADGRTDTKLTFTFHNIANAPEVALFSTP